MTRPNPDDPRLAAFLRQHRSPVPPPALDLEERLLQNLPSRTRQPARAPRPLWLMAPVLAAGLLATWFSYHSVGPLPPDPDDLVSLESFLENNWDATVEEDLDVGLFPN